MADVYSDTVLQTARAFIADEKNKKFQTRPVITQVIDVFMKDREYTVPNLAAIKQATTQATHAMYLNRKAFTIGTTKSCTPSGEQSGSTSVEVDWTLRNFVVKSNFTQHQGNEVGQLMAMANDMWNGEISLWSAIDQILLDYLESNKSGVNAGASGTFNAAEDIMWITNANKSFFYNLVSADMQMNNFNPMYLDLFNTAWEAERQKWLNQGSGNSTNTAFQFDGFQFFKSNLLSGDQDLGNGDSQSIHYVVPEGGVAVLDWNDPLNRGGKVSGNTTWTTMRSILRPEFTFDVLHTTGCADTSTSGGKTQDFTETWEFSLNFATAKQPLASGTPIFKYGVLDGDTYPT